MRSFRQRAPAASMKSQSAPTRAAKTAVETASASGARFVIRASVNRYRNQRGVSSRVQPFIGAAVPLANVIRFTGRSRTELLDLVRAGILEQVPGRRSCELTAASLQAWMTGSGSYSTPR